MLYFTYNMNSTTFELAKTSDLPAILALNQQLISTTPTSIYIAGTKQAIVDSVAQSDYNFCAVVRNNNLAIGYISSRNITKKYLPLTPTPTTSILITSIYIDPAYREQGLASKLLDFFLTTLKSKNFTHAFAKISSTNLPSLSLFKKHGFLYIAERTVKNELPIRYILHKSLT